MCALRRHNMAADIPFMEVTGRKDVQNGGRSILKMTTGFGLFSTLSKVKIYFFLLFTSNLSYFNSFKLPYKIRLLGFRSPLRWLTTVFPRLRSARYDSLPHVSICRACKDDASNLKNYQKSPQHLKGFKSLWYM